MPFQRIAILGLGLMGGSVARAVRAYLPDMAIHAQDIDAETLRIAEEMHLADLLTENPAEAVAGADLVLLAAPLTALAPLSHAIAPHLAAGAVVTDIASVKRPLSEDIAPLLPEGVSLVPGHPIAGSEKQGVAAGTAMLFAGQKVILTPENPETEAVARIARFWKALRAEVQYMPAALHDEIYACTSHLPHYLSFIMSDLPMVAKVLDQERCFRLAHSPLALWEPIFFANKDNINKCLDDYLQSLHQIRSELREGAAAHPAPQPDARQTGVLFARIAASCLIHAAYASERALHVKLKPYTGPGFTDFTAPLALPPDDDLERISTHAESITALLDDFAMLLSRKRYIT